MKSIMNCEFNIQEGQMYLSDLNDRVVFDR